MFPPPLRALVSQGGGLGQAPATPAFGLPGSGGVTHKDGPRSSLPLGRPSPPPHPPRVGERGTRGLLPLPAARAQPYFTAPEAPTGIREASPPSPQPAPQPSRAPPARDVPASGSRLRPHASQASGFPGWLSSSTAASRFGVPVTRARLPSPWPPATLPPPRGSSNQSQVCVTQTRGRTKDRERGSEAKGWRG